jgi:hypothetical protein
MSADYKNPMVPNKGYTGTWLEITSRAIDKQTANVDKDGGLILGDDGPTWEYLLPENIAETINNTWEPWETISSRLAGLKEKGMDFYNELTNAGKAIVDSSKKGVSTQIFKKFGKDLGNVVNPNFKVDTPLVYQTTNRREWNLELKLYCTSLLQVTEMVKGVKVMKHCSMPVLKSSSVGSNIELPYAFKLLSINRDSEGGGEGDIIKTKWCALTSFQPTYKAPFDDMGRPMIIDLSVTFKELSPLYAPDHEGNWWDDNEFDDYFDF